MKTYYLLREPLNIIYFWLNYCDGNHHIERIPVAVKDINHLLNLASEIIETDRLPLFLLSGSTRIDHNKYLESLENSTELIVCTEEQIQKLSIYFELKRYLSLKNISYPLDCFLTLIFIEAVISSNKFSLVQSVFNSLYIYFEQAKRVRNE